VQGKGATTRNGHSIQGVANNTVMRRKNRAIRPVANSPKRKNQVIQKIVVDQGLN
jgi:hypothetical protein